MEARTTSISWVAAEPILFFFLLYFSLFRLVLFMCPRLSLVPSPTLAVLEDQTQGLQHALLLSYIPSPASVF